MSERRKDVRKLFIERMRREGREKEWNETVKRHQGESEKFGSQATWAAMKELGYQGPDHERKLAKLEDDKAEQLTPADENNIWEIRKLLPDRATVAAEINWVLSNNAMFRRARNRNAEIQVNVKDVLGPPKCPSKAALTLLQHCVNAPNEFYKQFLSEMKRVQKDDQGNTDTVEDTDLDEVNRMLDEMTM